MKKILAALLVLVLLVPAVAMAATPDPSLDPPGSTTDPSLSPGATPTPVPTLNSWGLKNTTGVVGMPLTLEVVTDPEGFDVSIEGIFKTQPSVMSSVVKKAPAIISLGAMRLAALDPTQASVSGNTVTAHAPGTLDIWVYVEWWDNGAESDIQKFTLTFVEAANDLPAVPMNPDGTPVDPGKAPVIQGPTAQPPETGDANVALAGAVSLIVVAAIVTALIVRRNRAR